MTQFLSVGDLRFSYYFSFRLLFFFFPLLTSLLTRTFDIRGICSTFKHIQLLLFASIIPLFVLSLHTLNIKHLLVTICYFVLICWSSIVLSDTILPVHHMTGQQGFGLWTEYSHCE